MQKWCLYGRLTSDQNCSPKPTPAEKGRFSSEMSAKTEKPVSAAEAAKLMEAGQRDADQLPFDNRSLCERFWSACCDRCCRCMLAIILFPFVIVLTILAFIVWLILLPRK